MITTKEIQSGKESLALMLRSQ